MARKIYFFRGYCCLQQGGEKLRKVNIGMFELHLMYLEVIGRQKLDVISVAQIEQRQAKIVKGILSHM